MSHKSIELSIISLAIACIAFFLATVPIYITGSKISALEEQVETKSKSPVTIEMKGFKFRAHAPYTRFLFVTPYFRGTWIFQAASSQGIVAITLLPTTIPFASIWLGLRLAKCLTVLYT